MILIIGGAYQGKRAFAQEAFGLTREDFFSCTEETIDFSRRCLCNIEAFSFRHPDPVGYFQSHRTQWQDRILILGDISCGVVPMGEENRAWRQKNGHLAQYLSKEASEVYRIFCGLEMKLK